MNLKERMKLQLGMSMSTARSRLRSDILFKLAVDAGHVCFRCGQPLDRDSFSIEHKQPWLDADDPQKLYFDLDNIAFSHIVCNVGASRPTHKKYFTEEDKREAQRKSQRKHRKKNYCPKQRHDRYVRTGN